MGSCLSKSGKKTKDPDKTPYAPASKTPDEPEVKGQDQDGVKVKEDGGKGSPGVTADVHNGTDSKVISITNHLYFKHNYSIFRILLF